jgi:hypothetical protein
VIAKTLAQYPSRLFDCKLENALPTVTSFIAREGSIARECAWFGKGGTVTHLTEPCM